MEREKTGKRAQDYTYREERDKGNISISGEEAHIDKAAALRRLSTYAAKMSGKEA